MAAALLEEMREFCKECPWCRAQAAGLMPSMPRLQAMPDDPYMRPPAGPVSVPGRRPARR